MSQETSRRDFLASCLGGLAGLAIPKGLEALAGEKKKARLDLVRDTFTDQSTIGKLSLNGEFICYTLELPWRENQARVSCIPTGVYRVRKRLASESKRCSYDHLEVQDVPNRSHILFHVGNYPRNTVGCILVGETKGRDLIGNSRRAFTTLMNRLTPYDALGLDISEKR